MKKQDGRKRTLDEQQEIRKLVVEKRKQGISPGEIAKTLGITRRAEQKVWKKYQEDGTAGIIKRKRGKSHEKAITLKEENRIRQILETQLPDQSGFPFGLWTREFVNELIFRDCGIKVSKWTIGRYLKEWGFVPKKTIVKAMDLNPTIRKNWYIKNYPVIQRRAKLEKGEIFWGDRMVIRTKAIRRLDILSATNNRGLLKSMSFKGLFDDRMFIEFLARLCLGSDRKILLILNGFSSHKTMAIQAWLQDHINKIELFFLPDDPH
jgi:transposase